MFNSKAVELIYAFVLRATLCGVLVVKDVLISELSRQIEKHIVRLGQLAVAWHGGFSMLQRCCSSVSSVSVAT